MRNRTIYLESKRLESYLINFQIEGALLEVMKNDLIARSIIAEHRKIEKYALQLGLIDKRQLNEGLFADVVLGLGQAVGGLPYLAQMGVGAAFGVAGVLWYGKEMLGNAVGSFDFFMNLVFALLSAAAIEPTGIFAEAGAFGKLIKPLAYLGQKVRALGGMAKAAAGLGPAEKAAAEAASGAAGLLSRGLTFLSEVVLPKVGVILESVKTSVMKLPGGTTFTQISELITKHAGKAIEALKNALSPFLRHVETATVNAQIAAKQAAPAAMTALMKKMPLQTANRILVALGEKQFSIAGKKCFMDAFVAGNGFTIKFVGEAGPQLITAARLPSFVSSVLQTFGKDAAAAVIVKAQTAYPQAVIKTSFEVLRPFMGAAEPATAAAV